MPSTRAGSVDPLLLVEVTLALLLFGLAIVLYLIPSARAALLPDWWAGILLAILFFAIVFLDTMRRRRRGSHEVHRVLDHPTPESRHPEDPAT